MWVKATLTVSSEGDDQVKQAVLGVCQHQSEEMESGAPWSGQVCVCVCVCVCVHVHVRVHACV